MVCLPYNIRPKAGASLVLLSEHCHDLEIPVLQID